MSRDPKVPLDQLKLLPDELEGSAPQDPNDETLAEPSGAAGAPQQPQPCAKKCCAVS